MFLPSISRNDSFLFEPIYLYVFWASSLKGTSAFFALLFNLFPLFWEWDQNPLYIEAIQYIYIYIYMFYYIVLFYIYINIYIYVILYFILYIYDPVFRPRGPPLPPEWDGSPGSTPTSLLFASYWQHFWGPASYLLGFCSDSDYQPPIY